MSNYSSNRLSEMGLPTEETQQLRVQLAALQQRLLASENRYARLLEAMPHIVWTANLGGAVTFLNQRWQDYTGVPTSEALGFGFLRTVHPEDCDRTIVSIQQGLNHSKSYDLEFRLQHQSGVYRWVSGKVAPILDDKSEVVQWVGTFTDIDRFKQMQLQRAVSSERKSTEEAVYFLAQASTLLGASLDCQTVLQNLAKLMVPYFADWCAIAILEGDGLCHTCAVAHADWSKEILIWKLQQRFPANQDGTYSYLQPLRTGPRDACFEISDDRLCAIAEDAEHLNLLRELSFRSYICLPIRLGNQIFGSILFVRNQPGHLYTNATLALAEDLTRRAAIAMEKALLYQEAHKTGENLRHTLLALDEQQQQLQTLQRLTNLINQRVANLQNLLQSMVDAVVQTIVGAQFCLIVLHDPEHNNFKLTATAGRGTENLPLGQPLHTVDQLLNQVFTTGQPRLVARDIEDKDLYGQVPSAVCAVAIESAQAGRLGVLAIGNWDNSRALTASTQQLLVAVGEQAAIAINNARLIKALERREELLELQNQILVRQNRELENQRQRIELQNLQLLEAAQLKSQFLTTVSHELRTPMNAIIGFSELLLRQRQNPLNSQQVDMVHRILKNGKSLLMLINDILDLSKIEAGRMGLELEEFDLANLIITTTIEFSFLANEKNLALSVCIYLDNRYIVNDRARLRQVLVNLVSNAIKFTQEGGVYIHVWELSLNEIAIVVRDTGIGISEADLSHIFEKFRQADQTTKRKYPGTGLGLALTASLVNMMNGKISVESQVGKGSLFRVELARQVLSRSEP